VHAWVCDKRAKQMSNEVRGSVAEHLRVVSGGEKSGIKAENLRYPIHHLAKKSYEELRKNFTEIVIEDQRLFESQEHVTKVLEFLRERFTLGDDALRNIQKLISRSQTMDSDTFFNKLEEEIERIASSAVTDSRRVRMLYLFQNLMDEIETKKELSNGRIGALLHVPQNRY